MSETPQTPQPQPADPNQLVDPNQPQPEPTVDPEAPDRERPGRRDDEDDTGDQ